MTQDYPHHRKLTRLSHEDTETLRIALWVLIKLTPLKQIEKLKAEILSDSLPDLRWYRIRTPK